MTQLINNLQQNNLINNNNQDDINSQYQSRRTCSMKGSFMITIGRDQQIQKQEPKVVEQQIEDEVLLTQLKLDEKNIIIYDIASQIHIGDIQRDKPLQTFKCLYDPDNRNFYVELSEKSPMEHLTKTTFLKILDIAENMGAERVLACLHNKLSEINIKTQTLLFVGFRKLNIEELQQISKTRTHTILCYDLQNE